LAKEFYNNILSRLPAALVIAALIFGILYIQNLLLMFPVIISVGVLLLREWLHLSKTKISLMQIISLVTPFALFIIYGEQFIYYFLLLAGVFWLTYGSLLITQNTESISSVSFNNNYLGIFLIQTFMLGVISVLLFSSFFSINNFFILFLLLFISALGDVVAYLVGSSIGKTPLFPKLSPNKTVEGFLGGMIAMILFAAGIYWLELISFNLFIVLMLVTPFTFLGDYFESQLKRNQQIKDSGSLIPGHGGIWDRLDSHISVIPVAALLCLLLT
jgi:phosphatidate cytidylyltransferase